MTKRLITAAVVITGVVLCAYVVAADDSRNGPPHARARLDGYQENPSISTTGRGEIELRIDRESETIEYVLSYSGLEATAVVAHIHFARERVNGPVSVFLCGGGGRPMCPEEGGTVEGTITGDEVPAGAAAANGLDTFGELVQAIRAGATYANVHSTRWPGGEIRGQIHANRER